MRHQHLLRGTEKLREVMDGRKRSSNQLLSFVCGNQFPDIPKGETNSGTWSLIHLMKNRRVFQFLCITGKLSRLQGHPAKNSLKQETSTMSPLLSFSVLASPSSSSRNVADPPFLTCCIFLPGLLYSLPPQSRFFPAVWVKVPESVLALPRRQVWRWPGGYQPKGFR